jgi:anti-sigma B factor antagonist
VKILTSIAGACRVITIIGSADIGASASLREALLGALEAGHPRLVCDLAQTDFICSDALGVLITAYLKARGRGGFLRLAGLPPQLREILETTRLDRLFEVFPSIQDAVERA